MLKKVRLFRTWISFFLCAAFLSSAVAQDETLEDFKYKEDYDRIQSIVKTADVVKRAERMVTLYSERRDMDSKLRDYADNIFAKDMEALMKLNNYLFYGVALKRDKKIDEALKAFARAYGIDNPLKAKAKQQLDITYRATGGSLSGQEKLVKDAMKDLK
jgi:tetratricopeptide (TPR) repeat protein